MKRQNCKQKDPIWRRRKKKDPIGKELHLKEENSHIKKTWWRNKNPSLKYKRLRKNLPQTIQEKKNRKMIEKRNIWKMKIVCKEKQTQSQKQREPSLKKKQKKNLEMKRILSWQKKEPVSETKRNPPRKDKSNE